jgi:hypothetical protein
VVFRVKNVCTQCIHHVQDVKDKVSGVGLQEMPRSDKVADK